MLTVTFRWNSCIFLTEQCLKNININSSILKIVPIKAFKKYIRLSSIFFVAWAWNFIIFLRSNLTMTFVAQCCLSFLHNFYTNQCIPNVSLLSWLLRAFIYICWECTVWYVESVQSGMLRVYSLVCWECTVWYAESVQSDMLRVHSLVCWECTVWHVESAQSDMLRVCSMTCWDCTVWYIESDSLFHKTFQGNLLIKLLV